MSLSGANTYTGGTTLSAGVLFANNISGSATGTGSVTINGGTFGGTGAISGGLTVNSGGTLSPGISGPSAFGSGSLVINAGGVFKVDLNSSTAGTGYDQLNITGTVNLTGSTLVLASTRTVHGGDTLTLINNDASDAIIGTFSGLAEGATVVCNGVSYTISYHGGTGNDVVLTDAAPTVATAAHATPTTVTGTTVALSVLGASSNGESTLSYTWSLTSQPASSNPTFSVNGTNVAKNTTVTFNKAGSYTFLVTISNGTNTATSTVTVPVNQTLTTIGVSPLTSAINENATQQFSATAFDQFGIAMASQPTFTWSFSGNGTLSNSGLYTASNGDGAGVIKATSGIINGIANISIIEDEVAVTTVTLVHSPSTYGQSVQFTGTVNAISGGVAPTGTVQFSVDGTPFGSPITLSGSGLSINVTSGSISTLAAANHVISAQYSGDGTYDASNGTAVQVVGQATPTVTASWSGWTFDGTGHAATGSVTGVGGVNLGGPTTFTYYSGNNTSGTNLGSAAPINAGTYTVVAHYAGSGNYTIADSSAATITIAQATPTVTASWSGWTFDGTAHAATGSVTGVGGANLGSAATFTYYSGGTSLGGIAPVNVGTYTVVAHYAGGGNYTSGDSAAAMVTIAQATPTVTASWSGWTFDGTGHAATGSVTGVGGVNLGGPTTFTYYSGNNTSGTNLGSAAPINAGTYTVVAHYAGSGNYTIADSSAATITIAQATPTVTASWSGWTFDGTAHAATGSVTGVGGANLGSAATFTYYSGGTSLGGIAPVNVGTYTVVAHYAGGGNYTSGDSAAATITVIAATPVMTISWNDWTYDGTGHPATGSVAGVGGINLGAPTFSYYTVNRDYMGTTVPVNAGGYYVYASYSGNSNYKGVLMPTIVTVAQAVPIVTASWSNWTFDGNAHAATGSVAGVVGDNLGIPSGFTYYFGTGTSGTNLGGTAPTNAGTYTVVAHYSGSANYTIADSAATTITIAQATPTVTASWSGWTFDGTGHPATGSVTGVGGANLGSPTTFTYYSGSTINGTSLGGVAPVNVGTYTVVAHYSGGGNYKAADSVSGATSTLPTNLVTMGGTLFFTSPDGPQMALWKSDGSAAGTAVIKDMGAVGTSINILGILSNKLFFTVNGTALWTSDGTAQGTQLLKTFSAISANYQNGYSNAGYTNGSSSVAYNGKLYFAATDASGNNLWQSDGTTTALVNLGGISNPSSFFILNGNLDFYAYNPQLRKSAWYKYDGTSPSIFSTALPPAGATQFTVVGNELYYTNSLGWNDTANGVPTQLWVTDGTNTSLVVSFPPNGDIARETIRELKNINGKLYFSVIYDAVYDFGNGNQFEQYGGQGWTVNVTTNGSTTTHQAVEFADIVSATFWGYQFGDFTALSNGNVAFVATDDINGPELWTTDGTADNTQSLTSDIFNSFASTQTSDAVFDGTGTNLVTVGYYLYFSVLNVYNQAQLWRSDGTIDGTQAVQNIRTVSGSALTNLASSNSSLFAVGNDGFHGNELLGGIVGYAGVVALNGLVSASPPAVGVAPASPRVTLSWTGGVYDGTAHPATGSVIGVGGVNLGTPSFRYFDGTSGNYLGTSAPITAGSYSVSAVYNANGNYSYAYAYSTITITLATPLVTASWSGWTYDGTAHAATGSVGGVGGVNLGVPSSFTYYSGTGTGGMNLGGNPPSNAGTYTVVAHYAGSTNYNAADSVPATITIARATPIVTASWSGWTYDATAHGATGSVTGVGGTSLGVPASFTYYLGADTTGTILGGVAPTNAGTYTVVAHFAGSGNYAIAESAAVTITVAKAIPAVTVFWDGWSFDGNVHPAIGSVAGVGNVTLSSPAATYTYYVGSGTGGPSFGGIAPSQHGNYTVVAHYAGSANYLAADSSPKTVSVSGPANQPPHFTSYPYTGPAEGDAYVVQNTAAGVPLAAKQYLQIARTASGAVLSYPLAGIDPDGDAISFSLVSGPAGAAVQIINHVPTLTWTVANTGTSAVAIGSYQVRLRVTDDKNLYDPNNDQLVTVNVVDPGSNLPPQFTSSPVVDGYVSTSYIYSATAKDPDGDTPLTFTGSASYINDLAQTVVLAPTQFVVNTNGRVNWTPTLSLVNKTVSVQLQVSDGRGGTADQRYQIYIHAAMDNHPPVIVSTPPTNLSVLHQVDSQLPGAAPTGTSNPNLGAISGQVWLDVNGNSIRDRIPDLSSLIQLTDKGTPVMPRNDDDSDLTPIDFGFGFNFFGQTYTQFYINNNGEITFNGALSEFTPDPFPLQGDSKVPMIAPFWADVDTNAPQSGLVYLNSGTSARGNPFVQITWDKVGYFNSHGDKLNDFTLYIENDPNGAIVAFVYRDMQWTTGDASNGSNGFGGVGAQIGFDAGDGTNYLSMGRPDHLDTNNVIPNDGTNLANFINKTIAFRIDASGNPQPFTEPGADGFVVELVDPVTNRIIASQPTTSRDMDGNGNINPYSESGLYQFDNVSPGNYVVRVATRDGWVQSDPGSSAGIPVTVTAGSRSDNTDFGEYHTYFYPVKAIDPDGDPLTYSLVTAPTGAIIDPQTGRLDWFSLTPGTYDFTVSVDDGRGGFDQQSFSVHVVDGDQNVAPVITSQPRIQAASNQGYSYHVAAEDNNLDPLLFQLTTYPQGMIINPATGEISWKPANTGDVPVVVVVSDGRGGQATQSFIIHIAQSPTNLPPIIDSTPVTMAIVGQQYLYDVAAHDPEGDILGYTLSTHPSGMSIQEFYGYLRWTPSANQIGNQVVALQVFDDQGNVTLQTFTIRVVGANASPTITSTPTGPAAPGIAWTYQATATDPNGDPLTFSGGLSYLNGSQVVTVPITAAGLLVWTPPTTPNLLGTSVHVAISVNDGHGGVGTQDFWLAIAANQPPTFSFRADHRGLGAYLFGSGL